MTRLAIFDLDGTVIDSSHRHAALPCGNVDLVHWVENSTPDKIFLDSLLPLIEKMREFYNAGVPVAICTARVLKRADFQFFLAKSVPFNYVLSRPKGCTTPDGQLKSEQLLRLFRRLGLAPSECEMWDDNPSVLSAVSEIGVKCHDARKFR
jgi:beta-phosphoglucomutase-like phosphatase (HAD superfamily)